MGIVQVYFIFFTVYNTRLGDTALGSGVSGRTPPPPPQEPSRTRAHPPSSEVMQAQRRIPFTASVGVTIVDRRGVEHRTWGVQDRRLAVGRVGVALGDGTCGCRYSGDGVLMVATERSSSRRRWRPRIPMQFMQRSDSKDALGRGARNIDATRYVRISRASMRAICTER